MIKNSFNMLAHHLAIFDWPMNTMLDMINNLLMVENKAVNIDEVKALIVKRFGIEVPEHIVLKTIDQLVNENSVLKIGTKISITNDTKNKIEECLRSRKELEQRVVNLWIENKLINHQLTIDEKSQIKDRLRVFIGILFLRQGAESMAYLNNQEILPGDVDVESILNEMDWPSVKIEQIARTDFCDFFASKDIDTLNYLYGQMQTAISYLVNVFDPEFISGLKEKLTGKLLYLDSSVVYRLLGLQGQHRAESVQTALDLCCAFGMKLCVNVVTLKELKRRIKFDSNILRNNPIPTNLAAIGINYLSEENFVSTYWYHAKKSGVRLEDFIAPFTRIEALLREYNIEVETKIVPLAEIVETRCKEIESKLRQNIPINVKLEYEKSDSAYVHDAYCLALMENMRGEISSFIDFPSWFITTDRSLIRFQKCDPLFKNSPPVAILPSQIVGILGFIQPASTSYVEAFLGFFSHAFIPAQTTVSNSMIQEILGRINYYKGSPALAEMILSDQILLKRISACTDNGDREEIIHDSLIQRSEEMSNNLVEKTKQIESLENSNRKLSEDYGREQREIARVQEEKELVNKQLSVAKREAEEANRKFVAMQIEKVQSKTEFDTVQAEVKRLKWIVGMVKVICIGIIVSTPLMYQIFVGSWRAMKYIEHASYIGVIILSVVIAFHRIIGGKFFEKIRTWITVVAAAIGISIFIANLL